MKMALKLRERHSPAIYFFLVAITLLFFPNPPHLWAAGEYPTKPVNMIVAYAAGGAADLCSKPIADKMAEFLGQPMISVYKPGGGGSLGASFVARAKPDGYTVLLGSSTPLAISPVVKKMDYTLEDFALIGIFGKGPLWLLVKGDARWKTLKDFVEEAKKNPGKLSVGSYGQLSASHFCIESFSKQAGIKLTHVPYKSSGEAQTALLGGHIDSGLVKGAGGHLESGALRVLAAAAEKRLEWFSDIPTFKEFGYSVLANQWNSFCVPKKTPPEIVNKLIRAQKSTFEKYGKELKEILIKVEYWADLHSPEESLRIFREEREEAKRVAEYLGVAVK
jgi:tripartite-type tricarboxylate transporter receptor subunit TctC